MTETTIRPVPLSIPPRVKKSRNGWSLLWMALFAALASGGVLWASGVRTLPFWGEDPSLKMPTLVIDRGDIPVYVVESGALESADNATIKCEVEALLGQVTSNITTGGVSSTPTARVAATATASTAASTTTAATGNDGLRDESRHCIGLGQYRRRGDGGRGRGLGRSGAADHSELHHGHRTACSLARDGDDCQESRGRRSPGKWRRRWRWRPK